MPCKDLSLLFLSNPSKPSPFFSTLLTSWPLPFLYLPVFTDEPFKNSQFTCTSHTWIVHVYWLRINHHVSPILNIDASVITLAKDSEKVLHLGPFVCLSVWLFVCLSVCLSAQNFCAFLHNFLLDCDGIFSIGATTHVECSNDEYDIICHMVLQPYWKNGKKLDLFFSETAPRKKLKLDT